jgi:hypothetical protein
MNIDTDTGEISEINVFFKTPYNHDTSIEAARTALYCKDPTKAQQHPKEECDINTIVDRFLKTGTLPQVPLPPTYENFGEVFDFQSAMNTIKAATDSFMALPANVRTRFQNDPAKFVAYVDHCHETGDLDPLREMGLAVARAPESRPEAEPGANPQNPPEAPKGPST